MNRFPVDDQMILKDESLRPIRLPAGDKDQRRSQWISLAKPVTTL
ncbi:hypothetical protein [Niabella hibiscisoli]|nr:hypothetical protein [Niabella hibiscisoli]